MGLDARNPVFGVSDKGRLKPVSSAREISKKIENLLVTSLDMILSNKYNKVAAWMGRLVCAFVGCLCHAFLAARPICCVYSKVLFGYDDSFEHPTHMY